jgi:hypothetical protein
MKIADDQAIIQNGLRQMFSDTTDLVAISFMGWTALPSTQIHLLERPRREQDFRNGYNSRRRFKQLKRQQWANLGEYS